MRRPLALVTRNAANLQIATTARPSLLLTPKERAALASKPRRSSRSALGRAFDRGLASKAPRRRGAEGSLPNEAAAEHRALRTGRRSRSPGRGASRRGG